MVDSASTHNVGDGLDATNNATVVITRSTFTRNTDYGFCLAGGGVIKSTGDNVVEGNGIAAITGGSLTTLTKQ
jgi:hypothetical protein